MVVRWCGSGRRNPGLAACVPDAERGYASIAVTAPDTGLFSGAFPLAVASPIWWLRLGDSEAGVFGRRVHFSCRAATAVAPELPLPLGLGNPAAAHLAFM